MDYGVKTKTIYFVMKNNRLSIYLTIQWSRVGWPSWSKACDLSSHGETRASSNLASTKSFFQIFFKVATLSILLSQPLFKIMKTILSEEEYMERLGAILKRDFFPILQNEFSEPEQLSISEFQSLFTTEDNASFEELLARENARKRAKFQKVFGGPALLVDNLSKRLLLQESKVDEWKFKGKGEGTAKSLTWSSSTEKIESKINLHNTRFKTDKISTESEIISSKLFDTPGRFRIPQSPAREQLAHSLMTTPTATTAKISKQKIKPKVPKYSMEDLKALTPRRKS